MAVAHVWVIDGEMGYTLHPVLAIKSKSGLRFTRRRSVFTWYEPEATADRMEEAGWEFSDHINQYSAVFDDPEYGLIDDDDELLECSNNSYGRILFAWGEDGKEDAARVKPAIEELRLRILDKLEMEKRRKESAKP
jgi:hypothetical protein